MTQPAARTVMQEISPKLAELSADVLFGDVWERPELSKRDRSLITVATLTALYRTDQLARTHRARAGQRRDPRGNLRGDRAHGRSTPAGRWPPTPSAWPRKCLTNAAFSGRNSSAVIVALYHRRRGQLSLAMTSPSPQPSPIKGEGLLSRRLPMPRMTGARFLAETLREYGVTHVFFVPAIIRRALVEMEDVGIQRVISHGEKSAAYMADAYARVTGKPGLCFAQSVGAANLAAGLQDAYLGVSPVIAITGHRPPMHRHRNSYQEIEHSRPFASVTKYSVEVETVDQLPHLLRQAFREVTTGQTLPAHLDFSGISGDVITDGELDIDVIAEEPFMQRPAFRPEPEPERVREAARILSQAERPVIVAGGGVTASGAEAEVTRLAEMLNIPVATALNAKGCIPENHPLSVGVVGSYSRWSANRVVSEADLVLFIGSHTGSQVTLDWRLPAEGTPTIQIDIDASELGRSYANAYGLLGDAKRTLERLIDVLEPTGGNAGWVSRAQEHVQNWRDEHEDVLNSDAVPIRPERLCQELTDFLPVRRRSAGRHGPRRHLDG